MVEMLRLSGRHSEVAKVAFSEENRCYWVIRLFYSQNMTLDTILFRLNITERAI